MAAEKLTKKQQKAAHFKAGKKGKAAAIEDHPATPDDVPDDTPASAPEASTSAAAASKPASEQIEAAAPVKEEKRNKKRKRLAAEAEALAKSQADAGITPEVKKDESKPRKSKSVPAAKATKADPAANAKKTTFGDDGEVATEQAVQPEIATTTAADATAKSNKFILFVGNMAFTTTADYISKHFGQACGEVPTVRLLTRKADPNALAALPASKRKSIAKGKAQDPSKPQSKGCAFVEFKTSDALRKALKFHHTLLEGRKINVELTAGGGGKSEARQEKIRAKNAGLDKERQKLHGKYVAPKNEARKQQRGAQGKEGEERPSKRSRRDEEGEGAASWGRSGGQERKMPRFMATGSNAVRVAPTS
ncbi:related to NOP6-protein with possible role in rRNA processing [Sporisorium reilianum f. sp. reilianum]|uniref:Related to NOP6-protein with possible role in rRNA processing n=1 Tax=Sporisorium reilianum f. sp. reilianum TaxID=72559 RepID=A0A2N8U6R7_9BASI|nr:related to NOP6-protein with possible role in rRNA processing [Sporisorium reilianum f. sp. reilianum]